MIKITVTKDDKVLLEESFDDESVSVTKHRDIKPIYIYSYSAGRVVDLEPGDSKLTIEAMAKKNTTDPVDIDCSECKHETDPFTCRECSMNPELYKHNTRRNCFEPKEL